MLCVNLRKTTQPCLFLLGLLIMTVCSTANAQEKKPSPAELRALDFKAQKAEQEFLKSMVELATDFEKAGDVERSKAMLNSILKLKPDAEQIKNKLKEFEEEVFDRKSTTVDLDVATGWVNMGIGVSKDKPVRIAADGVYRLVVNEELGPKGYPQKSATKDLISDLPTGALIGMVAPIRRQKNAPDPKPFLIGDGQEIKPDNSGILYLRVNTPPQAKCVGKLKIKLSGNITSLRKE